MVELLVGERVLRRAAARLHLFGQPDHLVDGLLAAQIHHERVADFVELLGGLVGAGLEQHLDHQGHHDLGPTLADQAERAVKVEQDVARRLGRPRLADDLDAGARQETAVAGLGDGAPGVGFAVVAGHGHGCTRPAGEGGGPGAAASHTGDPTYGGPGRPHTQRKPSRGSVLRHGTGRRNGCQGA